MGGIDNLKYFSLGQQKVLSVLAIFLLGILTFKFYYSLPSPSEEITQEIVIEVLGEVRKPGVHIFQHSPTLKEALQKAGGLKEPALLDTAISSEVLETGTLLTIVKESPALSQSPPHPSPLLSEPEALLSRRPPVEREKNEGPLLKRGHGGINQGEIKIKITRMEANKLLVFNIPLDLNRVSMEDLCLLPGIGESLAREIVAHREKRRGFRSVEELKNIKGIGDKKYQSLKNFLIAGS